MVVICVAVQWGEGVFVGTGSRLLSGVSATMMVSKGETDGAIVSSTLENRGVEKMVPMCVAIQQWWEIFVRMGFRSLGGHQR